jgi:eukaryotic-like serine/threonine-protein kinase
MNEDRLPELYLEAVELDEPARQALLVSLRRDDPALAEELARLLATPEGAASPIDGSALVAAGLDPLGESVPASVGPYRILRELGEGGMGRVFLAEHETPDFRRRVALKVISRPGPDDEAVRRFRAEVRILASLDHPGIVRFLDGGRSAEGIWFLAQEYIEGADLLTHCRKRDASVAERLALFRSVLEAVEAAHAQGVVHRDLKPANVLVGADGRPRLLDFGISKLVDTTASTGGALTHTDTRALTPAYASPEQLAGRPATVASDIFSLGVILYELLSGERPFGSAEGSREALERAVRESDPEPPSSAARRRSGTTTTGEPRESQAARRATRAHGPDLDAICLKALRKEPGERYASAGAFAEDVQRYLEGRPVAARRGGLRYRVGRIARRHRGRLTTTAALVVAAAALLVALRVQETAGRPPRPEVFPFSHLRTMPLEELERRFAAAPEDLEAGAALSLALTEKRRLEEAQILVNRLRQVPGAEGDALLDYADGTVAMYRHESQRALVLFTRARDGALRQGRGELLAQIRAARGSALLLVDQPAEAAAEMKAAAQDFRLAGDDASLARVLNDLAIVQLRQGELGRAELLLSGSVRAAQHAGTTVAATLCNLALLQGRRGRPDLGVSWLRQALELYRQREEVQGAARTARDLSVALRDLGEVGEADRLLAEAIASLEASGAPSRYLVESLFHRAAADLAAARLAGMGPAIERLERAAEAAADTGGAALAHRLRGELAALQGDAAGASGHFEEGRRLFAASGSEESAAELSLVWAEAERRAGRPDAALRVLPASRQDQPEAAYSMVGFFGETLRARIEAARGEVGAARQRLERLGEDSASSPSLGRRLAYLAARASVAAAEKRPDAARADLEGAVDAARRMERRLDELELRLELAALAEDPGARSRLVAEIQREASEAGLAPFGGVAPRR